MENGLHDQVGLIGNAINGEMYDGPINHRGGTATMSIDAAGPGGTGMDNTNFTAGSAPADVFPDFAISLQEANRRVAMLKEFVRDHMVEGEDYGVIPGASNKPTLFKPGAEKLNAIFGLAPIVEITNRIEDWDAGFAAYEVKVTLLNKRTQNVEAEGIGSCNSRERRYKNQDAANVANTLLKMAKKRALIDATLSATRASGMFTQDLEDMDIERNDRDTGDSSGFRFTPARSDRSDGGDSSGDGGTSARSRTDNTLTEAQYGAILAIAGKVFGRTSKEELAKLVDKPITQLTKGEASSLIDRLRGMAVVQSQSPAPRDRS